jgi:hypothetical protein
MSLAGILEQEESELALMPTLNLRVRRNHLRRELWVKYHSHLIFLLWGEEKHERNKESQKN